MRSRVKNNKETKKQERKRINKEKKEKRIERIKKNKRNILITLIALILLLLFYSTLVEPNLLKVNEYKLTSSEISNTFHGIKIVHFSDLHYGKTINASNIDKVIKKINKLNPDIVIFTGDLIDSKAKISDKDKKLLTTELNKINYNLGKYAIIGNHDYYNKDYSNIMYDSEFMVLKNSYDVIYNKDNNPILIYGLDNITYGDPKTDELKKEELASINYRIVIMHEPDYVSKVNLTNIDLVLAGHSHNGQVRIGNLKPVYLPEGSKTYYNKYYKIGDTDMYISNGIGTSLLGIRFGNVPSINYFRLIKKGE